jgi:AcrR family transcriptional regulator
VPNRQTVRGVRTGGRSERVREAVLEAAFGELIDVGYAALSVESIAVRAGVNKTTIYRRWPTLEDLLVDALTAWSRDAIPVPDTGSIESDLLAAGRELAELLNGGVGRQVAARGLRCRRTPHHVPGASFLSHGHHRRSHRRRAHRTHHPHHSDRSPCSPAVDVIGSLARPRPGTPGSEASLKRFAG